MIKFHCLRIFCRSFKSKLPPYQNVVCPWTGKSFILLQNTQRFKFKANIWLKIPQISKEKKNYVLCIQYNLQTKSQKGNHMFLAFLVIFIYFKHFIFLLFFP